MNIAASRGFVWQISCHLRPNVGLLPHSPGLISQMKSMIEQKCDHAFVHNNSNTDRPVKECLHCPSSFTGDLNTNTSDQNSHDVIRQGDDIVKVWLLIPPDSSVLEENQFTSLYDKVFSGLQSLQLRIVLMLVTTR